MKSLQTYPARGKALQSERGEITFGPACLAEFEDKAIVFAHCQDEKGTDYIIVPGVWVSEEDGQISARPMTQEEIVRFRPTIYFNPKNPKHGLVHVWH